MTRAQRRLLLALASAPLTDVQRAIFQAWLNLGNGAAVARYLGYRPQTVANSLYWAREKLAAYGAPDDLIYRRRTLGERACRYVRVKPMRAA